MLYTRFSQNNSNIIVIIIVYVHDICSLVQILLYFRVEAPDDKLTKLYHRTSGLAVSQLRKPGIKFPSLCLSIPMLKHFYC